MIGYMILGIISLTLSYVVFNLTRKVERLETWIEDYAQRIQNTKQVLDEVDTTGHFEADDEIGTIFEAIKETVDELNTITEQEL